MSHPSLGLPPRDMRAGHPDAAQRLTSARLRIGARALEIAMEADATFAERYDELGLRRLVNDAALIVDMAAVAVASADTGHARHWAEMSTAPYRRRRVPMDDLVALANGVRRAAEGVVAGEERALLDAGLDAAIAVWKGARRLGGDARRRNRILAAIYKGA